MRSPVQSRNSVSRHQSDLPTILYEAGWYSSTAAIELARPVSCDKGFAFPCLPYHRVESLAGGQDNQQCLQEKEAARRASREGKRSRRLQADRGVAESQSAERRAQSADFPLVAPPSRLRVRGPRMAVAMAHSSGQFNAVVRNFRSGGWQCPSSHPRRTLVAPSSHLLVPSPPPYDVTPCSRAGVPGSRLAYM